MKKIFTNPLTHLILACFLVFLLIGSCVYSGIGAEQRAFEKITGVKLTKWEMFNTSNTILQPPKEEKAE